MSTYLIAVTLNDDDLATAYPHDPHVSGHAYDDLVASLNARLQETFCGRDDTPVRGAVVAAGQFDTFLPALLDAAEVGLYGIDDDNTRHAVDASIQTIRQSLSDPSVATTHRPYRATHVSKHDGSDAMMVSSDTLNITLVNEDGFQWVDPKHHWAPIE